MKLTLLLSIFLAILLVVVLVYYRGGEVPPTVAQLRKNPTLLDATVRDCARRLNTMFLEQLHPSTRCVNALEAYARESDTAQGGFRESNETGPDGLPLFHRVHPQ